MNVATNLLPLRLSQVRYKFDLSASPSLRAPSAPILFAVLSEHEMKNEVCYRGDRDK
jgi:hypothetical protein